MHKPLADFADIFYGKSPSEVLDEEGLVPVYGTGGKYATAVRALFSGPAVVLPRKGSLGTPHYSEDAFWPSDTTFAAIPKVGVDAKWLFYQLLGFQLEKLNEATGVPSISRDWLARIGIPDQRGDVSLLVRRVVETVDRQIEAIEALIAKQERLRAGMMHDLFARGVDENGELRPPRDDAPQLYHETELGSLPVGWSAKPVSHCVESISDGPFGSNLKSEHYVTEPGVRVIRLQNIQAGFFDSSDEAFVSEEHGRLLARFEVRTDDILIASLGDDRFEAGRACLYPSGLGAAINKADCFCAKAALGVASPFFLMSALNSVYARRGKLRLVQGVTRQRINIGNFKTLFVPIPDFETEEQSRIAQLIRQLDLTLNQSQNGLVGLWRLRSGLMQDLLSGNVSVEPLLQ